MADKSAPKDNHLSEPSPEDDIITSDKAYSRQKRRGFLMLLFYFLIALAFAVLVVFLGRWIYHRVHKSENPTTQPAANTTKPPASNTSNAPTQPAANNSTNQSPPSSSTPAASTPAATSVPNTGPGDVVGLFIGTAIVIGGLHFIYSLRRA